MGKLKDPTEEFGRKLMSGAMYEIGKWMILAAIGLAILGAVRSRLGYGWDDSDDRAAGVHSELRPLIDHRTGCQYIRVTGGGITPRLDGRGRQICG